MKIKRFLILKRVQILISQKKYHNHRIFDTHKLSTFAKRKNKGILQRYLGCKKTENCTIKQLQKRSIHIKSKRRSLLAWFMNKKAHCIDTRSTQLLLFSIGAIKTDTNEKSITCHEWWYRQFCSSHSFATR